MDERDFFLTELSQTSEPQQQQQKHQQKQLQQQQKHKQHLMRHYGCNSSLGRYFPHIQLIYTHFRKGPTLEH